MANTDFTHLHVHTEYSMLDGAARLTDLFEHSKQLGMNALATTDHGFLFGAFDFWNKANNAGVKTHYWCGGLPDSGYCPSGPHPREIW